MGILQELTGTYREALLAMLLTMPRIYAVFSTAQLLNTSLMSRMARNGLLIMIAMPLFPMTIQQAGALELDGTTFAMYFLKEYAIGFLIGFLISSLLWAVQAAGSLIDNQRGAAVASSVDPMLGNESSPMGDLFGRAFVLYLFLTPGFFFILGLVYHSYQVLPISAFIPPISERFPEFILGIVDNAMRLMFVLAAPLVVLMFLSEFALAIISRFDPQIQVFVLAMPIKSGIAAILFTFYLTFMLPMAADHLPSLQSNILELLQIFGSSEHILEKIDAGNMP
ncbi:type III secretion system export apparatus subunit SctT [Polycladidibacter hongkongensis]|uniref:type III secretion system export apparatus subunit SctT n=1 Tax=Polycladidibacter hongkongensis TaxID=1647556 RepID=UPI0008373DE8|nr:type III secretion system export apparatus subunit SctT [Pseudovibrio hongkongensis]